MPMKPIEFLTNRAFVPANYDSPWGEEFVSYVCHDGPKVDGEERVHLDYNKGTGECYLSVDYGDDEDIVSWKATWHVWNGEENDI